MASDYSPPRLVKPTPGGNPGDGSMDGVLTLRANSAPADNSAVLLLGNQNKIVLRSIGTYPNGVAIHAPDGNGYLNLQNGNVHVPALSIDDMLAIPTISGLVGKNLDGIYGLDNRTGLTAVDGAPITLYTTTASGQLYRLSGRVLATAGTSPAASYVIKWTEGGAVITKTLTIAALSTDADLMIPIQPDNGTQITAQLTAISGTGTTVNVAAVVEQIA